jgi:hypothetical protein
VTEINRDQLIKAIQTRLTIILNAERDLTALGANFDVIDKRELLSRFGQLAADTLNAFNILLISDKELKHMEGNESGEYLSSDTTTNDLSWQTLDKVPRDGTPFELKTSCTFRWMPYKPNSQPAREGKEGRWQRLDEKGQWSNTPPPVGVWRPLE